MVLTKMEPKRRHCMIVYAIYPLGETRVQREAEVLVRNGYDVDVICVRLPNELPIDEYKGVRIYREKDKLPFPLPTGRKLFDKFLRYIIFFISAAFRVTQLHFSKHYTSIQVHNIPDFLVFSTLIPKLMRVPIILDLHDLMPEFFSGHYGNGESFSGRLIRIQERLSCRFANHVITVSEHWRQTLIRRGVPEDRCSTVMNVADDKIFKASNGAHPKTKTSDCFRIIYHGSMHQRYGLDLAIQAIDKLRHEIPGIRLSLVGYGDYLPVLQSMVKDLGLQEYVIFEPLHLAEELPDLIRSHDLGVVPYRCDVFTDGLVPTKLMEYAALGMPAVASRTTTIQAYFSDANTEFFEPDNLEDLTRCFSALYHNRERLAELARGSQKFNQRYNWEKIGAEYVALVDRLRTGSISKKTI